MIDRADVIRMVAAFDDRSDGGALTSRGLVSLLLEEASEPFSRHHFSPGHLTCTGMVLAPDRESVLAVHHRRLNRWLMPGGHVEGADAAVADAARREVLEETGVELDATAPVPLIGIDVHGIPSNGREPYHLHHDLLFLFLAKSTAIRVSEESHDVAWITPDTFEEYGIPDNVQRAYRRALKMRHS
jgi:8-oxo-dGTP pyrophosphatase MutT (NUDIX family)